MLHKARDRLQESHSRVAQSVRTAEDALREKDAALLREKHIRGEEWWDLYCGGHERKRQIRGSSGLTKCDINIQYCTFFLPDNNELAPSFDYDLHMPEFFSSYCILTSVNFSCYS